LPVPSFFISHSSADRTAAERIGDCLKAAGFVSFFLDVDPEQGLQAARDWEPQLYAQLRVNDAVIFVSTASSIESKWCFAELALARSLDKPIFPVVLDGSRHPLLAASQELDGDCARLCAGLRRFGFDPRDAFHWDPRRSPYPGLDTFEPEDAAVFFGRERETAALYTRLHPSLLAGSARLVAVIGPSGSGKSSLVRAGLVPRLCKDRRWLVLPPFAPRGRPFAELAGALGELDEIREGRGLVAVADRLRRAARAERVLLVLDQAEELATLTGEQERVAFTRLLGEALAEPSPLWAVATVRSEFLTSALRHDAIATLIDDSLVVGPLDAARLAEVVERPAARAGLQLTPGLAARMAAETRGGDALPMLAYTLRRLCDMPRDGDTITIADYEQLGGVEGSLVLRAEEVTEELVRRGRGDLVVPTLVKLAALEAGSEPIRRRVRRKDLTAPENDVVDAFVQARLLNTTGPDGEATVEVAHEAIFRVWAELANAIDAESEQLRVRSGLERLAVDWDARGRPQELLSGDRLTAGRRLLEAGLLESPDLAVLRDFVATSILDREATLRRESEQLAARALTRVADDHETALLLALAACDEYAPTAGAVRALSAAMQCTRERLRLRGHEGSVWSAVYSPDGSRILTASDDRTARVWDAASGGELAVLRGHEESVASAVYSPDGSRILTASGDQTARVWDATSSGELAVLRGHGGSVRSAVYSPDGSRILTASFDGTARIWDAASGDELAVLRGHDHVVSGAAYSPDGSRILTASGDGTARIWDAASGGELAVLRGHEQSVGSAVYSPDGSRIVTSSGDRTARIWDAASGG
jgi:hypothetical protein